MLPKVLDSLFQGGDIVGRSKVERILCLEFRMDSDFQVYIMQGNGYEHEGSAIRD